MSPPTVTALAAALLTTAGCTERRGQDAAEDMAEDAAEDAASRDPESGEWGVVRWLKREVGGLEPYALDDTSRDVAADAEVSCDREALVTHGGEELRWEGALHVHPAFAERLTRFEKIARELAVETYGRPPRRIAHAGAFACRSVRGREGRMSEHALGNAVDVVGFNFGPLEREGGKGPIDLPRHLTRPFEVTIGQHWEAADDEDEIHERFLQTLTDRLAEERIFRGMIGPSQPGHERHLHLDAGPYRYHRL